MKLLVQKNSLYVNNDEFPCAVGKNGVTKNKVEGDGCTPCGKFKINEIYYRADKLKKLNFNTKVSRILENDGWCDDPSSKFYNKLIQFPFLHSAEKLHRDDDIYDVLCVIDYNIRPVKPGKGSAIFLHIAHDDLRSTEGCVALKKNDLLKLIPQITMNSEINIKI